jgi:L-rhamnose mutarotase
MAELLRTSHNFDIADANDLVDKVSRAINQNEKIYNNAGYENLAKIQYEEKINQDHAEHVQRVEGLLNLAKEAGSEHYSMLKDMINKNQFPENEISSWEQDLNDIIQENNARRTSASSQDSVEALSSYTEQELRDREQQAAKRAKQDAEQARKDELIRSEKASGYDVFDEMAGNVPKTGDVFGMSNPMEKVERAEPFKDLTLNNPVNLNGDTITPEEFNSQPLKDRIALKKEILAQQPKEELKPQSSVEKAKGRIKPDDNIQKSEASPTTNPHTPETLAKETTRVLDRKFGSGFTERLMGTGKFKIINASEAKDLIGGQVKFHKVWHGSPHDHDKFSMDKIGSGEGAQVYGWGLYFAGSREVAEWYRDNLSYDISSFNYKGATYYRGSGEFKALALIKNDGLSKAKKHAKAWLNDFINGEEWTKDKSYKDGYFEKLNEIVQNHTAKDKIKIVLGRLYEVDLAPEQDEYLLWDKPLSEQSERVKSAAKQFYDKYINGKSFEGFVDFETGNSFYEKFVANELGSAKAASDYLNSIGIRGIKYLDGSSRSQASRTADRKQLVDLVSELSSQVKEIQAEIDRNKDYPGLLPAFFNRRNNDIAELNSRIESANKKIADIDNEKDLNFNYVIFDENDIKIEAKYSKNGDIQAFYNPANDTSYFVADNIDQNKNILGLALHEIGEHALQLGKTKKQYEAIMAEVERLSTTDDKVKAAKALVPEDTLPEHVNSEIAAYLVENHPELSITQRIKAWFREALRAFANTFPSISKNQMLQWANRLTPEDIVFMATSALRKAPDSLMFDPVDRVGDGVMISAKKAGYEGDDIGEATEWLRAKAKGLDMSQKARMERARAMGFDVDKIYYHETESKNEESIYKNGFDINRLGARASDNGMPDGVFLKSNDKSIGLSDNGIQIPVFINLNNVMKFVHRDDVARLLRVDGEFRKLFDSWEKKSIDYDKKFGFLFDKSFEKGVNDELIDKHLDMIMDLWKSDQNATAVKLRGIITKYFIDNGYDGINVINDVGSFNRNVNTTVVFDPKNIRSINAAFDPDYKESANLLASKQGSGVLKAPTANHQTLTLFNGNRLELLNSRHGSVTGKMTLRTHQKLLMRMGSLWLFIMGLKLILQNLIKVILVIISEQHGKQISLLIG